MTSLRPLLLSLLLLLGGSACAPQVADPFMPGSTGTPVTLELHNLNFLDATVFICWRGTTCKRLGYITGKSTETYRFSWEATTARIRVRYVGREDYWSPSQPVSPGDILYLQTPLN